jgi:hypothetical protein
MEVVMKYQVVMNNEDGTEYKSSAEGVCFGSLGDISQTAFSNERDADALKGVRIQLTNDNRIKQWSPNRLPALKQIHDEVMGRWTDGIIEYEGDDVYPESVLYPASCPIYLMIASASFWRVYSNYANYVDNWLALEKHEEGSKMSGLVKHFLCHGLGGFGSDITNKFSHYYAKKKYSTYPIGNTGHAPFEQNLCEITSLCHLHLIDQQYILDNVPSLYDQMKTKGRLSYSGRDSWWYAPPDFTVPGFKKPRGGGYGAAIGLQQVLPAYKKRVELSRGAGDCNSYIYCGTTHYKISLDDYLEGFLKINDEVQSFVKSWT